MNASTELAAGPQGGPQQHQDRIDALRLVALVAVAIAFGLEGLAAQAFGLAVPAISKAWSAPREAFANVTAVGLAGFAIGAAVAGVCADRFGRRTVLLLSIALFGAGTLGTAACHGFVELGWVRFATGLGLGGSIPVAAALMSELSPPRWRRTSIALGFMCLPIGGFLSGMLASWLLPSLGWPSLFAACGAIALILALALIPILPESPDFLAVRPRPAQETNSRSVRWGELFSHKHRLQTLAQLAAYFFLLIGMYLMFSWGPSVLTGKGFSLAQASQSLSAFALGGVFAGPVAGWLTQRLGPKVAAAILGGVGAAAAGSLILLMTGASHSFAWLLAGVFLLGHAVAGAQTALYALTAEIYEASIRSSGLGLAVAAGRVGAVLSSYIGALTVRSGGGPAYFALIGAAVVLTVVAAWMTPAARLRAAPA